MKTSDLGDPYNLTTAHVASHLGESLHTIRRLVDNGQIPAIRGSKGYRFRAADVRTYIENQTVRPNAAVTALRAVAGGRGS